MKDLPQARELAKALTREYQVEFSLYEQRKPNTKTWDPKRGTIAVQAGHYDEPSSSCLFMSHELGHWLIATKEQRNWYEWGLGSNDYATSESRPRIPEDDRYRIEVWACNVQILIVWDLWCRQIGPQELVVPSLKQLIDDYVTGESEYGLRLSPVVSRNPKFKKLKKHFLDHFQEARARISDLLNISRSVEYCAERVNAAKRILEESYERLDAEKREFSLREKELKEQIATIAKGLVDG